MLETAAAVNKCLTSDHIEQSDEQLFSYEISVIAGEDLLHETKCRNIVQCLNKLKIVLEGEVFFGPLTIPSKRQGIEVKNVPCENVTLFTGYFCKR